MILFSLDTWFISAANKVRMDILVFLFEMICILTYISGLKRNKDSLFLLCGFFAGLAILTHPFGLIIFFIVIIHLLIRISMQKKYNRFLQVTLPVFTLSFIWILSIWPNISLLQNQFFLQFSKKIPMNSCIFILLKNYPIWVVLIALYSVIFISLVVKFLREKKDADLFIIVGNIISVILVVIGKERHYLLYTQPFITLGLLTLIKDSYFKERLIKSLYLIISLSIILININFLFKINKYLRNFNYQEFSKNIIELLPNKGNVFVVSFPDPYFDLISKSQLNFYEFPTEPVSSKLYKNSLNSVDYIILSGWILNSLVEDYIRKNSQAKYIINHPNGYQKLLLN